jgi:DNA mismatch repair protein MutL
MKIHLLSEETINKIAAGEVIERPANVLKELVENALDAGSTAITIDIQNAGRQLIRIQDNGCGMSADELTLAVTRHATSKISGFADIETLSTLGFRGEALPSIAAVSRLRLQSVPQGSASGWEIELTGGKITESRAWAGSPGTIIEVRNLFFNTPARAKFLKTDTTERHHILRIIEELALAWPSVAFRVVSEGKETLSAPVAATAFERLVDVLGDDFTSTLLPLEIDHPSVKVKAYVTRAEKSLSSRNFQFLFINGRPINLGKVIMHSLYEAYREHLPVGTHPGAVIFMEIDPASIDVNIHPTKREVKFSREQELHHILATAIKEAINQLPATSLISPETPLPEGKDKKPFLIKEPYQSYQSRPSPYQAPSFRPRQSIPYPLPQADFGKTFEQDQSMRPLAQVFNLYLIVQKGDELMIIDQHAAAERVRYEKYRDEWEQKHIAVQPLLLPITIELPASQKLLLPVL